MTPEQDRLLRELAKNVQVLRDHEADHFNATRDLVRAVQARVDRLVSLLNPFPTEWVDRAGRRGRKGEEGFVEAPTWVRWLIELTRGDRPAR